MVTIISATLWPIWFPKSRLSALHVVWPTGCVCAGERLVPVTRICLFLKRFLLGEPFFVAAKGVLEQRTLCSTDDDIEMVWIDIGESPFKG